MVMPGQFLERPTLVPTADGQVLEGLSHRGKRMPPLLVLPPPEDSGGMDHVVAAELAWAGAHAGHPVLRFNYRGVGASQGTRGDEQTRLVDAEAALRVLQENAGVARVAVCALGGSAPAALALLARHPGLAGLALVSPRDIPPEALVCLAVPLQVVMGQEERALSRPAVAAAVAEAQGSFEVIPGADATYLRNLPQVGKAVVEWLQGLE